MTDTRIRQSSPSEQTGFSRSRLEIAGHISFIVMCALVAAAAVKFVLADGTAADSASRTQRPPVVDAGTHLPKLTSLRDGSAGMLILGLSTVCQFCTDSMPFYRRLAALDEVLSGRVSLGVASFQPEEGMREYLAMHEVPISRIARVSELGVPFALTPTLVLADSTGVVVDSWQGRLAPEAEEVVIASLKALARQSR